MDRCSYCGEVAVGNSPTGSWCNHCGIQEPCECCQGEHDECIKSINKVRIKNNLSLVNTCCCHLREHDDEVRTNINIYKDDN